MNLCIHYGFGDYVISYGMIKELSKTQEVNLFVINHRGAKHIENIKRLFANVDVNIITDDPKNFDVKYIGFDKYFELIKQNPNIKYQEYLYSEAGIPINLLWDNFYYERDTRKEKEVFYDILGLKDDEDFIFLHDDPTRNFGIKPKYINQDIRIIHLIQHQDISILDTLLLVEKCKEFHVINTGLLPFVDLMKIKHENLNYHKYARPAPFEQPILKMKWNVYE